MTSPLIGWLVRSDPSCSPETLRAAWVAACAVKDVSLQAAVAKHSRVPDDLDVAIGLCRISAVRLAHLLRPGLSAERGAALLTGELRAAVLSGLSAVPSPAWATGFILDAFVARPTWAMAQAVTALPALTEPALGALVAQLLPQLAARAARQQMFLTSDVDNILAAAVHVASVASRGELLVALAPFALTHATSNYSIAVLLAGPLPASALELFAAPVLALAQTSLHNHRASYDPCLWRALLKLLFARTDVPESVLVSAQRILTGPGAAGLLTMLQVRTTAMTAVGGGAARSVKDLNLLDAALQSREFTEVVDALHNPLLTQEQLQRAVAHFFTLRDADVKCLSDSPMVVRHAVLLQDPAIVLATFGWDWFPDQDHAQRAFVARYVQALRANGNHPWRIVRELVGLNEITPLSASAWLELPARVVVSALRQGDSNGTNMDFTGPLATAVGAQMTQTLGADTDPWLTCLSLVDEFTGTIGELIETCGSLVG